MKGEASRLSKLQHARKRALWLVAASFNAAFLASVPAWTAEGPSEQTIEIAGFAVIALAVLGRTWCTLYIGGRKKRTLVTEGPYSLSRNPLYVFSVMGAFGIGATSGSIVMGALLAAAAAAILDIVIRREEAYLTEHFPVAYLEYMRSVPRWLSPDAHWHDAETVEVRPRLLLITLRDASLMLLALPVAEGIEALHRLGYLPVLLHLP
ncbi:methyltransferase family protein [Rhodovibrio salinarum]|uniref:Isoprenylcysteine carboxylmethyltransferase family protein n=1 Tax=Rhodovibrio salinarum TaxID=1087 RepID=A0A934V187_9PROT|nr:isoprenylcysteine carboxylmethyltransferase family protein [Rhodovibrio salinarum]MBK1698365.1 isoprenylcysteine carboxylmethyltransferase family protein [Rhodovibrio salinarum]